LMGGLPGGCGSIPFPFPLFPFCLPVSAVTVGSGGAGVFPPLDGGLDTLTLGALTLGALTAGALMLPVLKLGEAPLASVSGGSQRQTLRPRIV
jgi:hypothetical protein